MSVLIEADMGEVGGDIAEVDPGRQIAGTDAGRQVAGGDAGRQVAGGDVRRQIAALLPDLRAFARFLVRDRVAADDIVQDSLVRALAAIDQFQPGTNLKAWLFTILRNQFYEQGRRRKREADALQARFDEDEGTEPQQVARAELTDLVQFIWRLPPLLREALILVGAQELSHEEAAAICNVPVGTMKARLSRARRGLADLMKQASVGSV